MPIISGMPNPLFIESYALQATFCSQSSCQLVRSCQRSHRQRLQITEKDAKILEYLIDIREDPIKNEDGEDQEGFRLVFRFAPQEYFSNSKLVCSTPA